MSQRLSLVQFWQRSSQQRWRPRHLLVLLTISAMTVAVSSCAYLSYQIVRGLILDNLMRNALLSVTEGRNEIDQWLATRKSEVESIASSPIARSLDWSIVEPYLHSEAKRLKDFSVLAMVEGDGTVSTSNGQIRNTNVKNREHFQAAMAGKVYVSDPLIGRGSGKLQVIIAAPIWTQLPATTQTTIGELFGGVRLDRVAEVTNRLKYGDRSYAFTLNSKGVPIIHPDPELRGNIDKPAPSLLDASDPTLRYLATQMVGKKTQIELVQLEGNWVYVAYLPLRQANWSIALVIPRHNLEKQLGALNLLAVVVGALLAIASVGVFRQLLFAENLRAQVDRESLLNRLTGRIRASLELDQNLQTTIAELSKLLHLEWAAFGWYEAQTHSLEIRQEYTDNFPSTFGWFDLQPGLAEQLQQSQSICLQGKTLESEPTQLQLQARTYLAFPVRNQTQLWGYLICAQTEQGLWMQAEKQLLQAVADQLAIAITQSHLYSQTSTQVKLLNNALKELKATQAQLVQSEKMSSVGQMVAGVAHEINNPVNFIYGNLPHASQHISDLLELIHLYQDALPNPSLEILEFESEIELNFIAQDLPQILTSMRMGADRIRQIVLSLRNFSRLDEGEKKPVDLHEGIDNTLLILQNRLKNKIEVIKDYGKLPLVDCFPGQINQVFMNLLSNAVDALESYQPHLNAQDPPKIWIRTTPQGSNQVAIAITDNGSGIPAEIQSKIFDPFFTTKPVGKGTGLGLAISYQLIVEIHGGQISVSSPPTGGTTFTIFLPVVSHQLVTV